MPVKDKNNISRKRGKVTNKKTDLINTVSILLEVSDLSASQGLPDEPVQNESNNPNKKQ